MDICTSLYGSPKWETEKRTTQEISSLLEKPGMDGIGNKCKMALEDKPVESRPNDSIEKEG